MKQLFKENRFFRLSKTKLFFGIALLFLIGALIKNQVQIHQFKEELVRQHNSIEFLDGKVSDLESQNSDLESQNSDLEDKIGDLENRIDDAEGRVDDVEGSRNY